MNKRRHGQKRRQRYLCRGFTLLELLVVMFIMAIIVTFVTLNMSGGKDQLAQEEIIRLGQLIKMAKQEAILKSREYAIRFNEEGYVFVIFNDNQWQALEGDDLFRSRKFPPQLKLDFNVNGENVLFEVKEEEQLPHIYFFSSGEMTPFTITAASEGNGAGMTLRGKINGEILIEKTASEI